MPATKTRPKILSVVLTVALLFGSVPVTAFAESPSPGIGGEIVGFGDYKKVISVPVETPEEEVCASLPPHLPAKVIPHLQTAPPTDADDAMDPPNENGGNTEDGSADLPGENGDAAGDAADDPLDGNDDAAEDAAADPLNGNDDAAEDAAADPLNGNDDDDDGEGDNAVDSLDEIDASVPVTWQTAAYNTNEPGEYIFTAEIPSEYTLADGVGIPEITVTVTADELPGVALSDSRIKLAVGDTYTLTYSLPPDTPESSVVEWLTSDASVATVQEGLVTAAAEGSAEITAQLAGGGGSVAVCFVEVSAAGELKAITVFETPDAIIQYQSVEPGAKKESLILPDKLIGTVDGEAGAEIPGVTWECAAYSEETGMVVYTDPETGLAVSEYIWKPVLPEGYKLADDTVELPAIYAMLPAEAGVMAAADWSAGGAPTLASGNHTVTIYPDAKGTLEVPPSSEITIVGSTDWIQGAGPIAINIPETSSVTWQAMYWGTGSPLLNLQGAGDFTVGPGGAINNRGSGNAIIIDGSGMNVTVSGGSGSGEEAVVAAVTGTAIESQGTGNKVTVEGNSTVGNESASNIRPIINMSNSGDTGDNVFIHGGRVWTIGRLDHPDDPYTYAYAIQTYGNVVMTGGDVWSGGKNGRAINLVGTDSTATISGGAVRADGASGVAISTATTMISGVPAVDAVANSKVIIEGDAVVTSAGNYAIHTTGKASQVTIRGNAWVSTGGNGDAIYAENAAADSIVTVESGVVSAQNGYAIRTATNGQVEVSGGFVFAYGDNADGTGNSVINKRNFAATDDGIVAAWNQGSSIYIDGTNNDLDFQPEGAVLTWAIPNLIHYGYGENEGYFALPVTVIRPGHGLVFDNTKTGSDKLLYVDLDSSGTVTDIDEECEGQGTTWNLTSDGFELNNFQWSSESPAALIVIGDTVITVSGSNNLASYFYGEGRDTADEAYYGVYSDSSDITIDGGGFLTAVAMTEETDSPAGKSVALYGIKTGGKVTLQNGFLSAGGLTVTPGDTSFGISGGSVAILGGGIEAQGFTKAFEVEPGTLPSSYTHWEGGYSDPLGGSGTALYTIDGVEYGEPYGGAYLNHQHVVIEVTDSRYATISDVTVAGTAGTALTPQTAAVTLHGAELSSDFHEGEILSSAWLPNLPAGLRMQATKVDYINDTIEITFSGVPEELSSEVFRDMRMARGADYQVAVRPNPNAKFEITGAPPPATYIISYDANSGAGFMFSDAVIDGENYTTKTNAFVRAGYTFTVWNTSADGSGTDYAAGGSVPVTGDMTLYAQWTPIGSAISYDANTGAGSMASQPATYHGNQFSKGIKNARIRTWKKEEKSPNILRT